MKPAKLIIAAALAGTCAFAQNESAVSLAASNASTIHTAVAELNGVAVSAFAAEVIDAIATMPKNPITKVFTLVEASKNFLAESDEANMADVIVAMISNVPFEALPEWTAAMIKPVGDATKDMDETAYNNLVSSVVTKIGGLDETDEDKAIITAFAIKLLSRGADSVEDDLVKRALADVPAAYADMVASSVADVLAGDYSAVLAGLDIIFIPAIDETLLNREGGDSGFETTRGGDSIPVKGGGEPVPPGPTPPPKPKKYSGQD